MKPLSWAGWSWGLLGLCWIGRLPAAPAEAPGHHRPRVLLLGDSISIGYTPFVCEMLEGEAVVVRPMLASAQPENCEGTTQGVKSLSRWLETEGGRWDVIHFNFGLHDLKRVDPDTGQPSSDPGHPRQAAPEVYERQLRAILARLQATGARLIFATTTPVPPGRVSPHRDVADVGHYNRIALRVMREQGVAVNDLYSLALPEQARLQQPANVHFTEEGSRKLAVEVVRHIRHALRPAQPRPATSPARKPNVILVVSDDQGTVDAGCFGAEGLLTPALDELARQGVRFTQFYAAAPVCSPSRAALLTGRHPVRAGVPGNVSSTRGDPGMAAEQVTLAEVFKAAGYVTAHVGKWHLGYSPDTMPNAQGFDFSFGHMGGCIDNFSHFFYWQGPNRHDLWRNGQEVFAPGRFFPDLMVEEAVRFIETNQTRPFFLYFALNSPHYPYQGDPCWLEHYRDVAYPTNLYAAFVTSMDARLRQLLAKLDALRLREHTIIVFQSDNGHSTEERAHFGGGSAGPYRGAKFSLFEGGLRVPAILAWPGRLPAGEVRPQVAHACDWAPTLAALCGVPLPRKDLDGRNLADVLLDASAPSPHSVLHWQTGPLHNPQWAVREGDWKLLGNPWDTSAGDRTRPQTNLFLANLAWDPGERRNLARDHPEVVQRLLDLRAAWVRVVQGPGPGGN